MSFSLSSLRCWREAHRSLFVLNPLMTSDYYGENHVTQNYGTIYAGKIVGGFYGGIVITSLIGIGRYPVAFIIAGVMALLASLIALLALRRPASLVAAQRAQGIAVPPS